MAPRPDLMHRSVSVPTAIEAGGLGRTNVEVDVDRLLGQMDCRYGFETYPDHQNVSLVVAHQPVRAVGGDRRIVDVVARYEERRCRSESSHRMRGVNAAPAGVARAEYLGEHSGMRWRLELVPTRLLGRDRAPRHGRHEQIAAPHIIEQGFDDGFGAKPASTQRRDRAVNH